MWQALKKNITVIAGDDDGIMNSLVEEVGKVDMGKCKIIIVDDLMVAGVSVRNKVAEIVGELKKVGLSEDQIKNMIEVNVLCGSPSPYDHQDLQGVNIYSHFFIPKGEVVTHVFGWWKSPDYGFRDVISEDIFMGIPNAINQLVSPRAREMYRPYKGKSSKGFADEITNKMRQKLHKNGWDIRNI